MAGNSAQKKLLEIKEYDTIGRVEFHVSRNARSVRISVAPFRPVHVTFPLGYPLHKAEAIVKERMPWIIKHRNKQGKVEARRTLLVPGIAFQTKQHRLDFVMVEKGNLRAEIGKDFIRISVPPGINMEADPVQEFIRKMIGKALWKEGILYLPARTQQLAQQHGFKVKDVNVRDNRSRWGSCSQDGRITLNCHLMRLPEELSDLIILHELAHTIHHNHGTGFHALMAKICPDYRQRDKYLKAFSPTIF